MPSIIVAELDLMIFFQLILCFLAVATGLAAEVSWPQFRGPGASGIGQGDFPTQFGPDSNVVWKTSLPSGNSSPCVFGNRIFLTGFNDGQLKVMCIDRENGAFLWQRDLPAGKIERSAQLSHPATATPVTNGTNIFVYFGSFGLAAYDLNGNETWKKPLPIPITQHGSGTSPVLAGRFLILSCDEDVDSYLLALDSRTGETLWRTERPGFKRGFSTPLVWPAKGPREIIVAGTLRLVAYDLRTGTENWSVSGLPNEVVPSPIDAEGLIFAAGWTSGAGIPHLPSFDTLLAQGDENHDGQLARNETPAGPVRQNFLYIDSNKDGVITRAEYDTISAVFEKSRNVAMAVRPGGKGDVTDKNVVWKHTRGLPYCPSPLYYENKVYLVKNGGLTTCLDALTGTPFYQEERLGAVGDYYSSPVVASGKICVISQPGVAVIFRAGETLEVLARNPLGETVVATPAIGDNKLYLRTSRNLYAFGVKP